MLVKPLLKTDKWMIIKIMINFIIMSETLG